MSLFYVVGTADSVLIREVSFIQSVLNRQVPLYVHITSVHLVLMDISCECGANS